MQTGFARRSGACAVVLLVALGAARPSAAQVGTTTDIITGRVTGPDSQPLPGAVVIATSIETQVSRQHTTDARGRFAIVFPDGGGQYQVMIRFVGMAPARVVVARQADEDRLEVNVRLGPAAIALEPVTVRARATPRGQQQTPGETERTLTPALVARLPIDASDLNTLATLVPGVVGIAETDSTSAAFSVAGQRPTANNVTLDGLSFGSGSVPQDALRTTRIVTNTYDVARGQFSGGLVAATTRSGTNVPQGSSTYSLRDRDLAWGGVTSSPFNQTYTQNQIGAGFGGPIERNKVFAFGALQGRWRGQELPSLSSADPATLIRLGANPDSVAKFLTLVDSSGVPVTDPTVPADRSTNNSLGLLRLDWNASDGETVTLRLDGRWISQDPTRVGALSLPETGGTRDEQEGGVMLSVTSYLGGRFINELKGYVTRDLTTQSGFLALPAGRVQLGSTVSDTIRGVTTLGFGGNAGFPESSDSRGLEITEEISVLPGGGSHRVKLGAYLSARRLQSDQTLNQSGTFLFPTLGAFAANQPDEYTRTLAPLEQAGTSWNTALYLGDTWRAVRGLQLTYGARLENEAFAGAPARDSAAAAAFGVYTDVIPSELHLSPRFGFTWMPGGGGFGGGIGGGANNIVRGGIGDFRSLTPTGLYAAALAAPGSSNAEAQLVCIGAAVPTPDWSLYEQDPSSIPAQCEDTVTAVTILPHPNVTVFDPGYKAPRALRASLGVQHRVHTLYTVSVDASYARGLDQYGFKDLNLNTQPAFTLANEGGRPVYVPADSIVPATGTLSPTASRVNPALGQVLVIGSDLESDTRQLTLGFGGQTKRGGSFQVSYTYTRARDQSSFSCCSASQGFSAPTTAGDPNVREWSTSDFERPHAFLATVTYPINGAIEITAIGRLSSGAPYTPIVGSDINGDGARNDRAFVFDPASTSDTAVANGMRSLLNGGASGAACLQQQLGQIAARNSCRGPWQSSLDFQINWRPSFLGLDRRLTLSVLTVDLLGGLDEWLHGSAHLHGWGFAAAPDNVLLSVRGFDPVANAYLYTVNGRFGSALTANGGATVPFQIAFQGRFTIGPDQARDRLRTAFGGGGGGRGGAGGGGFGGGGFGGGEGTDFAARFANALPNPIPALMGLRDSLHLTPEQLSSLETISDSLDSKNHLLSDSLQAIIERAGPRPDPMVLFAQIRPKLATGRERIRAAVEQAHHVLTPQQWAKVPDVIKNAGTPGGRR